MIYLTFEYRENSSAQTKICCASLWYDGSIVSFEIVDSSLPAAFFSQAKPVIAFFDAEEIPGEEKIIIYYKHNSGEGFYYQCYTYMGSQYGWVWDAGMLENTSQSSVNLSLVPVHDSGDKIIHLSWQNNAAIVYAQTISGRRDRTDEITTISSGSSFVNNVTPSISLTGSNNTVVVSWLGFNGAGIPKLEGSENVYKMVTRVKQGYTWGDFFTAGDNVGSVNNNSVEVADAATVITWSELGGANAKWIKRLNTTYCNLSSLSSPGKFPQVSNAAGLDNIEVMLLNTTSSPYVLERCTNNFNIACEGGGGGGDEFDKITDQDALTYGRSGVIVKNSVEFVFNIGDVVVGDSAVRFLYAPDTVTYLSASEMSNSVRTENFHLTPASGFLFSDFYYVLYAERADTALTELDRVTFRAELVNASTGLTAGVFDEIIYDKDNLEKYDNISYQVNCSGITEGDYYLRLAADDRGESNYNLANVWNYSSSLLKNKFTEILHDGSSLPETYELYQNFPNPFNPVTTINYQIPEDGLVTLKLYDILGKEVKTLTEEYKIRGRYSIQFNASNLASGIYIYRIQAGEYIASKKMTLVK